MKCFALILILASSAAAQVSGQGQITGQGNITLASAPTPPPSGGASWAGILDSSRAADWSKAGVPGGIPTVTATCVTVSPSGIAAWKPSSPYVVGNRVSDTNGNLQQVTAITTGTSGTYGNNSAGLPNQPPWNTSLTVNGGITTDGGVTWTLQSLMPTAPNPSATYNGTDAQNLRQAAMNCGSTGPSQVIQLVTGTYIFTTSLGLQGASNIVLRGAGPMQTKLMFYRQGSCQHNVYICISPPVGAPLSETATAYRCGADWNPPYTQGLTTINVANLRGSPYAPLTCTFSTSLTPTSMTVSSGPGQIIYGSLIYLDQNEDAIGICPASGGTGNCTVAGATASGTVATIVTTMPHGFHAGQKVAVSEVLSAQPFWSPSTAYNVGQFIMNQAGVVINKVITAGTSGPCGTLSAGVCSSEPNWVNCGNGSAGCVPVNGITTDGTVQWQVVGCFAGNGSTGGTTIDATYSTSCFNSIRNTVNASTNDTTTLICGGPGVYGPGQNLPSPNFSVGCAWWQITDIGCIVSGAYVSSSSCGANPIIAFRYNLPATILGESNPSGGGYAGADTGGPFDSGQGQLLIGGPVIFLGSATSGRRCQNIGNWNTRNPPGDMQCIPAATNVPTGESSRRNTMEAHVVTGCTPNPDCTNPTSITIDPPILNANFRPSQNPAIYWTPHVVNVGVEDLTIDGMYDTSNAMQLASIEIFGCYACWVRNVRSIWGGRTHVWVQDSAHVEIRDTYIYGAKNGQSTSYGFDIGGNATSTLMINNISQGVVAPILPEGAVGSVEAYNYQVESNYNPGDSNIALQYSNHGFVSAELHESTNSNQSSMDNNHGTGWSVTFFRNRNHAVDFPAREAANGQFTAGAQAWNRFANYIGNILGWPGLSTNYQLVGRPPRGTNNLIYSMGSGWIYPPDDTLARDTAMRWGNYDTATGSVRWCDGTTTSCSCGAASANVTPYQCSVQSEIPVGFPGGINANPIPANHTLPASFFLTAPPAFWTTHWGTPPWPAIGPDITASGPLDTTCPISPTDPTFPTPNNPYACDGVAHHSYQIPSQMCFINTPIDPSYQYSFTVTGAIYQASGNIAGTTPNLSALYGGAVTLTVSGLDPTPGASIYNVSGIKNNRMIDVTGITPSGYNGIFVNMAVCGRTANAQGATQCTLTPPNQTITYFLKTGSANPGTFVNDGNGRVSGPDIRAFDAKVCYPQEPLP